jgi:hypothetical protein
VASSVPHDDLELFQPAHGPLPEAARQGQRAQLRICHVNHRAQRKPRLFEAVMDEIAIAGYEGSIARTGYGLDKGVGERECRMPGTSAHGNPSWIT